MSTLLLSSSHLVAGQDFLFVAGAKQDANDLCFLLQKKNFLVRIAWAVCSHCLLFASGTRTPIGFSETARLDSKGKCLEHPEKDNEWFANERRVSEKKEKKIIF